MAGINQTWNSGFEGVPDISTHPKALPQNVQDLKVSVRTQLAKEHEYNAGELTCEHSAGSAKAYSDDYSGGDETDRPDGTSLTSADAGRLQHNTDDNSLKVHDGSGFVHLFEDDDISDTAPATIASLQDKIDALAAEIKAIKGDDWDSSPEITLDTLGTLNLRSGSYQNNQNFTYFSDFIPTTGDTVKVSGSWRQGSTIYPASYLERTTSTLITLYGMSTAGVTSYLMSSSSTSTLVELNIVVIG